MKKMGSHLRLKDELQDEFLDFSIKNRPSSLFEDILRRINRLSTPDNIDVLKSIFAVVISKKNSSYIKVLLKFIVNNQDNFILPLLNEVNNSIEILFESERIGYALDIIESLLNHTDARTYRILVYYIDSITNQDYLKKCIFLSKKVKSRLDKYMKKIEYLSIEPILTQYDRWQE